MDSSGVPGPATVPRPRIPRSAGPVGIFLLAVVPYANAFGLPFIWEDYQFIVHNTFVHSLKNVWVLWRSPILNPYMEGPYFRPWLATSDMINWALGGGDPGVFHVTNVGVHAVVSLLLLLVLLKITRPMCAYVAAALFAVHPIHTESVTRISGRSDPWCALFLLVAFLLLVVGRDRRRPSLWAVGAAVAYVLALLSKEMALPFPFILLLWEGSRVSTLRDPAFRRALRHHGPIWLATAAYLVIRLGIVGAGHTPVQTFGDSYAAIALLMTGVLVLYVRLLVWPLGLSIFHNMPFVDGMWDPRFLVFVGVLAAITAGAWFVRRRQPLVFWAWVAFFALLSPVLNIFPITDPVSERFLYIPSAAFCVALAALAEPFLRTDRAGATLRVRLAQGSVGALVLLFAVLTFVRNRDYVGDYRLAQSAAVVGDRNPYARHNYGHFAHRRGEWEAAEREYRAAIAIDPGFVMPWIGLMELEAGRQAPGAALVAADQALLLSPENPRLHQRRGDMLMALHRPDEAVGAYQAADRLLLGNTHLPLAMLQAYRAAGRGEEARALCAAAAASRMDAPLAARWRELCASPGARESEL